MRSPPSSPTWLRTAGGSSICHHKRERRTCVECRGAAICEHNRVKSYCKECAGEGGGSICEHNHERSKCKQCQDSGAGGKSLCKHQLRWGKCKECFQSRKCEHQLIRLRCKECVVLRRAQSPVEPQEASPPALLPSSPPPPPLPASERWPGRAPSRAQRQGRKVEEDGHWERSASGGRVWVLHSPPPAALAQLQMELLSAVQTTRPDGVAHTLPSNSQPAALPAGGESRPGRASRCCQCCTGVFSLLLVAPVVRSVSAQRLVSPGASGHEC